MISTRLPAESRTTALRPASPSGLIGPADTPLASSTETVPSMSDAAIATMPLPARSASRRTYSHPAPVTCHITSSSCATMSGARPKKRSYQALASWNLRPRLQRRGRSHPLPQLVTVRSSATSCRRQRNRRSVRRTASPNGRTECPLVCIARKQVAPAIAAGAGWNAPRLDSAVYRPRRWPTARSLIFRRRSR